MPDTATITTREVRQNARHVIHKTTDTGGGRERITTVCGSIIPRTAQSAREWMGGTPPALTECPTCFTPEPAPTREVRENAMRMIHKTIAPPGRQHGVLTVCGRNLPTVVADARRWRGGSGDTHLDECATCFAPPPEPVLDEVVPEPVPITAEVRSNANRTVHRTADVDNATARRYPIVSICGETMTYAVRDPRVWNGHPVQTIIECPTCFAAPIPEQPVPPVVHPLTLCTHGGHIGEPHTHTTGRNALWGRPGRNSAGADRVMHDDGTEVLFASARHIAANPVPNQPGSVQTTERESTPVTETNHRFPVGTDIYPIDGDKLRDLPVGSVLTIRSRDRGEMRGGSIHFGCQNWGLDTLARAQAIIEFQPNSRAVVTADVPIVDTGNGLLIAGLRQGLGDVNEYARSIIVKEIATVPVQNALVMEHGFYGCVHHADHVIVVGMGREQNRGAVVPLVGQIRRVADGSHTLTGTVGVTDGMLHSSMDQCTPVFSSTSAYTMNFASERRWSLVPCTPAHIERMGGRNVVTGHVENNRATLCTSTGAPLAAPAAEPEPF